MNKSKLLSFIIVSFFLLSVITTVNAAQNDTQTTDQITDNTQNTNTNIEENTNAKVNQKSSDSIKTGNQNIKVATKKNKQKKIQH